MTIGFNPDSYTVVESDGQVTLLFEVLGGTLEREVTVRFMTSPNTATEAGECMSKGAFRVVLVHKFLLSRLLQEIFSGYSTSRLRCSGSSLHLLSYGPQPGC